MPDLTCIICPNSCRLEVDGDNNVTGNLCQRGEDYGREETLNPVRMLTSTVRVSGAALRRCPVRTQTPIPKRLIPGAMRLLNDLDLEAPVEEGFIVLDNICGTGIPFITTRSLERQTSMADRI